MIRGMWAVLTGDLVRSSALSSDELDAAREALRTAAGELERAPWAPSPLMAGEVAFFRGDSWQLALPQPRWALRCALYLRASVLVDGRADSRIAIGLGSVKEVAEERVSLSTGEAFERSGRGLDEMGPRFRMTLSAPEGTGPGAPWLRLVVHLCDSVVAQWQGRQIEAARLMTLHPEASLREIGEWLEPRITQQAVSKSLLSAGWHGVAEALETFESALNEQPYKVES